MIISVFNAGISDSSGPIDYLLGDKDHAGQKRSVDPEVVRGDAKRVGALIDCNRRKWRYTSGVINFRSGEDPSPDLQQQIMNEFEEFAFAGKARDTWESLWVRHLDKETVELHFLLPRIDLETGQDINAFQRGWDAHWRPWQRDMCALHGFTDPHTVRQLTGTPKRETETRQKYRHELYQTIEGLYQSGAIHSRERLEEFLTTFATINRISAKTVSIKYNNAEKPMKLEGPIFEQGFFETSERSRKLLPGQKPDGNGGPTESQRVGNPVLTPRASETDPSPFARDRARAFEKRREYFEKLRNKARRNDKRIREQLATLDDIRLDANGSGDGGAGVRNTTGRETGSNDQTGTAAGSEDTGKTSHNGRSRPSLDAEVGSSDVGHDGEHVAGTRLDIDQRAKDQEPDSPRSNHPQLRSGENNRSHSDTRTHGSADDGHTVLSNRECNGDTNTGQPQNASTASQRTQRIKRSRAKRSILDRGAIDDRTRNLLDRLARSVRRNANDAGRAAQNSRRRAETARQRTLDSALRAEDAERRKYTTQSIRDAIAQITRNLIEVAIRTGNALGRLTQQVTNWVNTQRTVQSELEPVEQKHEDTPKQKLLTRSSLDM